MIASFLVNSANGDEKKVSNSPFFGEWRSPINVETNIKSFNPFLLIKLPADSSLIGSSSQYHELGVCLFYGTGMNQNYSAARESFIIAASQGYEDSKYYLGVMYLNGLGVLKDEVFAAKYFFEAAFKGNSPSQYQYGMCLKNGIGAQKDPVKASAMFLKAAEQGHSDAQYEMGMAYRTGKGVEPDDTQAIYWLYKAAIQGNMSAKQNIEDMAKTSKEAKEALDKVNYKSPPRNLPPHQPKNRILNKSVVITDLPLSLTS